MELVNPGHIPGGLHPQIELVRARPTLPRVRESDLESLPIHVVERLPTTLRNADQVPENFESVVVYRRFRPDRSHIGIVESWVEVHDHPDDFYRKFVN